MRLDVVKVQVYPFRTVEYSSNKTPHTMDLLWEKFQRILPLYMKLINFQSKASVFCSVAAIIFIHFSQHIVKRNKWISEFRRTNPQELKCWSTFCVNYFLIRKSKDYVYGIWVYKVLGIWKGYYRVKKSLVSCIKPWTEARNNRYMKYHSKLTYQLSFWNVSRKVDYHAGGKWFIHGPKRRLENQVLSLKHPCWLPWDITYWCSINLLWKELMERMCEHTGLISSFQVFKFKFSSLLLLLVQTQAARWKAATPEQLTGAQLYLDIAKSGYLFHAVGNVMRWASLTLEGTPINRIIYSEFDSNGENGDYYAYEDWT